MRIFKEKFDFIQSKIKKTQDEKIYRNNILSIDINIIKKKYVFFINKSFRTYVLRFARNSRFLLKFR